MEEMVRRSCMEEPGTPQPVEMMCCKRTKKGAANYCYLCFPCLDKLLQSDTTRCPLCRGRLNWVKTAREKNTLVSKTLRDDMLRLLEHFPEGYVPDEKEEFFSEDDVVVVERGEEERVEKEREERPPILRIQEEDDGAAEASQHAMAAKEGEIMAELLTRMKPSDTVIYEFFY
jgi:hypothetical protein